MQLFEELVSIGRANSVHAIVGIGMTWFVPIATGVAVLAIAAAAGWLVQRARARRGRASERIELHPPSGMEPQNGYRYWLRMVREGRDEIPDVSPLLNNTVAFEDIGEDGSIAATVKYHAILGLQFKCFVDVQDKGPSLEEIAASAFPNCVTFSLDERLPRRFWFLLDSYPRYTTVDGYVNNFLTYAPEK
jgi:hypothetical protein